jgi:amino acid transporter
MIFLGFDTFVPWDTQGFITSYFGLPFALVVFVGYKYTKGTRFVSSSAADLYSGKIEIDNECRHWEEGGIEENETQRLAQMNIFRRAWEKCW